MIQTKITGIGDPFILRTRGRYYAYATSAQDGFRFFTSENLTDWQEGGYCYRNGVWGENDFWAPEVYEYRGKFYLLYSARWKKNRSLRIGLAVSDCPQGPFLDVTEGPLFDFGYAAIDGTLFFDKEKIYLFYSRDCSENVRGEAHVSEIYAAELAPDLLSFLTRPRLVSSPDLDWEVLRDPLWLWNEGPSVIRHGGNYYLNYSANCYLCPEYAVGCAVAASPLGPYIKYPSPVLKGDGKDFSGPGHNAFFRDETGKLYTSFHIHTDPRRPSGDRRMCIAEAGFDEAGVFFIKL